MEIRFCINENPPSESMLHEAITQLEEILKGIKKHRSLTAVGIAILALIIFLWIYLSFEIGWTGITGTAVFSALAIWAGGTAMAAWVSVAVIAAIAVVAGLLSWGAMAVIVAMIALACAATIAGWHFFDNKLNHFNGLIETLKPVSQSDNKLLFELAEKQPTIRSYLKSISTLESARIPVKGEYNLLVALDKKYDQNIANKENQNAIVRECKLIISF